MFLAVDDLRPWLPTADENRLLAMIADAESMATLAAPCLGDPAVALTDVQVGQVTAILRRAVIRWHESGTGVVQTQTAGPFGQTVDTTRSAPRGLFWPSEIVDLQAICKQATGAKAATKVFSIQTGPSRQSVHSPICSLMFGAAYCSCGSDLNAYRGPIPEYGETMGGEL